MPKNSSINIGSIEERKELLIDIEENLEPQAECCIYRVSNEIRKVNEEAYTPKMISIGPLHHGKAELAGMEKQKIRYKREFAKRIRKETWDEIVDFLEKHEQRIRNCYDETCKLRTLEFITMILYDAVFIIEFFLRVYYRDVCDFLVEKTNVRSNVWLDLQLLENQLPYFVLEDLYTIAFPNLNSRSNGEDYPAPFLLLSYSFINDGELSGMPNKADFKHFTDLRRYIMTKNYRAGSEQSRGFIKDLPCALKLHESGVKFKRKEGDQCFLDLSIEKKKYCALIGIPWLELEQHELQIPRFEVFDETEALIRNVMALEQCHYPFETHVCSYFEFMDSLVDTEQDVDLLVDAGVISNNLGDSARAVKMFNSLCSQIYFNDSDYYSIVKDLKAHYDNPWNHTKATLKKVYFSNLWRGTGTVAAIVLLLLTLIQAICSILQVV